MLCAMRAPADENTTDPPLIAGVELGGTKSFAVLARGTEIVERLRIPTTDPAPTLTALSDQLAAWRDEVGPFAAIGIGSFGPIGADPARSDFGYVTTTPKPGWRNTDVRRHFAERFDVPIAFDSDVAGAALSEERWGASRGCSVHVYLTIGTGIGGGVVVDGEPLHGLVHPEVGHLRVRRRPDDTFGGSCPFHGDCIEGLASGPAIAARAGRPAEELGPEHPVWLDVAAELAELMTALVLTVSPERIVVGGGVAGGKSFLLDLIRVHTATFLGGYVAGLDEPAVRALIQLPELGDDAGPLGTVALALRALGAPAPAI
jgi:fructokinase